MPLVSVIVPYYKKIDYIKKSINSILSQTFKDFEIILIYDDSELNDLSFINKEYGENSKIKIIKNSVNFGAGVSRNIGIEKSSGKIIAFLDADDIWLPQKLEKQTNFMIENKFDFTFCNYEKKISTDKYIKVKSQKNRLGYDDLIKSCDIGLSTVLLNREIIKNELFPPIKTKEDYVAWLKITKENIYAYNLDESLVIWNQVKNSLSSNFLQKISDGFKVYYTYEKFSIIKSLYCLFKLSVNSLKRKI
ncbi:MAG: glycosyltransferase family 2 protein [Pelagibacterales bacterium]|nr:glycosyltransferase family 2 protein [Pelagibacterales bacterium]|tara:strand:+ start:256 stop:999 length:744 start_codon:yes stop_codon:yes gene_type:complete